MLITIKLHFDGESNMLTDHPSQIRAALRSGSAIEIGAPRFKFPHPSRAQIVLGFAAIYLIWGSTYLGIRYAVETIPPLLMMGIRHFTAGLLVFIWARRRGDPAPTRLQWGYATVTGALLFLGGHGTIAWAEQRIPSGLTALLCATLPLWTVLLASRSEGKLGAKVWTGLLLGFGGVALLIGPDAISTGRRLDLLAAAAALSGAFLWAAGTIYSQRVKLPTSTVLSAAMQMVAGGAALLIASLIAREPRALDVAAITGKSVFALAYLIVFGSIIAFTVFTWLVSVSSSSQVSTYAYVNPVVAVFLGWALADERIGIRTIAATVIILASVALVSVRGKAHAATRDIKEMGEVSEAAGD
jgi:drug/metabolite transporter (DMT)-like permease